MLTVLKMRMWIFVGGVRFTHSSKHQFKWISEAPKVELVGELT